jgi:hypothetical protein
MTIGTLSLDPRRVLAAELELIRGRWLITVKYLVGDTMTHLEMDFVDKEDAEAALAKLDGACYKGPLADAVADKTIDDDQDDEDYEIGFFREKT